MGINFLIIYGEKVKIAHHKNQLGMHTDFYGYTTYEDMEYEIYTDGYGNMMALFVK